MSDSTTPLFSPKQIEFIRDANKKFNLAHGAVRSGKTICTLFKFLQMAHRSPGDCIIIFGFSQGSIYNNVIRLIMESQEVVNVFRPFCNWSEKKGLTFGLKTIKCIGAGDEGALGLIQGMTIDLCYCDEITLYPENVIEMIKTRLSKEHSQLYASMNPRQPSHKIKQWIDMAEHDDQYYQLHFTLEDNPYLPQKYKDDLKKTLTGLFFKRNYLGLWCLAEGAIFDFFDTDIHTIPRPPCAAEYWVAGIDYGTVNAFACVIVGVNSGIKTQTGKKMWVEKEYYWDPHKTHKQKTNSEFVRDVQAFLEPYAIKAIYVDPSAAAFKEEMRRNRIHIVDANNEVNEGIYKMTSLMMDGTLAVCRGCTNLISEIEGYVWDSRKAERGEDAPLKQNDHAIDALRYVCASHKVATFDSDAYYKKQQDQMRRDRWQ